MRFSKALIRSGMQLPLLLLPAISFATPVPASYHQQQPLAVAHAGINEVGCAQSCFFDDSVAKTCTDEKCLADCRTFSSAYWKSVEQCIQTECSAQTHLGLEYIKNMKQAVENHCAIMDLVFTPVDSSDSSPEYLDPYSQGGTDTYPDDPNKPPVQPKPPCPGDPKTKPKKPKKHKDVPPPVRRRR